MARKLRLLFPGAIYHVMFRGNARQAIFVDDADRQRLLMRLAASAETSQVEIYLYCLMNNHVHLLVCTPLGNLSRFMASLLTGYTVYYNRRHRRVGHLLQGRYKAQVVAGDAYMLKLSRYLHLNPVFVSGWRHQPLLDRVKQLRQYRWSSYRGYVGLDSPLPWVKPEPLWALTGGVGRHWPSAYREYVEAGLAESDESFRVLMDHPVAIGGADFVAVMQHQYATAARKVRSEDVALRKQGNYHPVERVWSQVMKVSGAKEEWLRARKRGGWVRGLMAWALQKHAGLNQREVAERLGVRTGAAISHLLIRWQRLRDRGDRLGRNLVRWQRKLNLLFKV